MQSKIIAPKFPFVHVKCNYMHFIEVDGEIHNNNLEKDIHRDKILQNLGFFVLHVRNEELSDMDLVLSKIKQNFR